MDSIDITDEVSNLILEKLRRLNHNQHKILKALQDLRQDNASIRGELTSINGAIVRLTERLDLMEEK